jgi:hypothetical protein
VHRDVDHDLQLRVPLAVHHDQAIASTRVKKTVLVVQREHLPPGQPAFRERAIQR